MTEKKKVTTVQELEIKRIDKKILELRNAQLLCPCCVNNAYNTIRNVVFMVSETCKPYPTMLVVSRVLHELETKFDVPVDIAKAIFIQGAQEAIEAAEAEREADDDDDHDHDDCG